MNGCVVCFSRDEGGWPWVWVGWGAFCVSLGDQVMSAAEECDGEAA